jgi:hypothetical protein
MMGKERVVRRVDDGNKEKAENGDHFQNLFAGNSEFLGVFEKFDLEKKKKKKKYEKKKKKTLPKKGLPYSDKTKNLFG